MKKLLLLAAFALPVLASAQTTTTYTGTVRDLNGAAVTSGQITWQLNAPSGGVIPGTGSFVSSTVSCLINASGAPVSAADGVSACTITNNTALTPTGTSYTMCRQPYFASPGSCIVTYATGGTVDVSTIVPTPATQPSYGVCSTVSCLGLAGGTLTGPLNSPQMNGVINASLQSGSDIGAKINAAFALCSAACEVYVPAGTYSFTTTIALPVTSLTGMQLRGAGSKTILNYTGAGDAMTAIGSGQSQVGLTIADLQIQIASATSAIHLKAFNLATLQNVMVKGTGSGDCVLNEGANSISIYKPNFSGCSNGYHGKGVIVSAVGYSANAVYIFGGQIFGNALWGRYEDATGSTGSPAPGCNSSNGDFGVTYDFNGSGGSGGNVFIQCSNGHMFSGNYLEYAGGSSHTSEVSLGDVTYNAKGVVITGNQFFSAGTTTNTISDVNSSGSTVSGNSEYGSVTNFYNHGTASRNTSITFNLATAATNLFAGSDAGSDTFGVCGTCLNAFVPGSRGIAVNGFEGGANHIIMREGANPDGAIVEYQNQGGSQKAKIDNTGWGYFANYVSGTTGVEVGTSGQNTDTPIKLWPSVAGQAIFWMHNVNGVLNFTNGAGSGMTPGSANPFTMNAATGDYSIPGGYKIGANIVIPSTATGFHGSSATKVQMSDTTGTTGHVPMYASDGSLTDSGAAPANRVITGYCQGTATASSTLSLGGLGGSLANCTTGTAVGAGVVMPTVATIAGLYVRCGTTGVNASSGLFTVYDQPAGSATAAATPITITYGTTAANTLVSDTGHATAVSAGDLITVKFTTQAAETLANCSASVTY